MEGIRSFTSMNPGAERIIEVFNEAKARAAGPDRDRFLAAACRHDRELEDQVHSLLQAHEDAGGFLKNTAPSPTMVVVAEKPGERIGRYKLLQELGQGGCGVVYMAEQEEPIRRRVALKVIKLGMDTKEVVARFEAERQALALMDHPNIAQVIEAGATGTGRPFFVMELVRGIKITDYCNQANLATGQRIELFLQVCQAVQHAHQKGIIHRDLKPSNILVTLHDGVPVPKIIDFGIAKATSDQRLTDKTLFTAFEQFIGTPAYMSPEQAEMSGLGVDTRTDIYSLGVLLYELLTGSTPFDARQLMASGLDAMRKTIREREPVRPSTRLTQALSAREAIRKDADGPDVEISGALTSRGYRRMKETITLLRGDLDWIVMKCLEKDRNRRYETANGLAMDLKRHRNNEPVVARPPSTAYRLQKAWRRNRAVFSSAMLMAGIVMVALAFSISSFLSERRARINEAAQRQEAEQQRLIATASALEATAQRGVAEQNQAIAEENARRARVNLYAADMSLAQRAVQANNFGRAAQLIDRHRPQDGEEDLRHWEWRFLWQQLQGDELHSLPAFDHHVFSLDHSPDGRHLAIALYNGRIQIWDLQQNRRLRELAPESEGSEMARIAKCLYTPDGQTLIAYSDRAVRRWSAQTYNEEPPLKPPDWLTARYVRHLAVSRDGRYVATYGAWFDEQNRRERVLVMAWDAATGEALWTQPGARLTAHMGTVCFSADATRLFVGEATGRIRRHDVAGGEMDGDWLAHDGLGITALALSPDGRILASGAGYTSGDIKLWDAETGEAIAILSGHSGWVSGLEFSADGSTLASASADQTARLWDMKRLSGRSVLKGHREELYALSLSPDASTLITGSKDGIVSFWSTRPKVETGQYVSRRIASESCFSSPDGKGLFTANEQGQIVELDPMTLQDLGVVHQFGTNAFLTFLPDAGLILATQPAVGTKVFDLRTRRLERILDGIVAPRYSPFDGRLYAVRLDPPERVVWDVNTWEVVATSPPLQSIRSPVFSPDNRLMAWESRNGRVSILAAGGSGDLVPITEFKAHRRFLSGLEFSPDGRLLATTSQTGSAYLWSVESWTRTATLRGHARGIHGVRFSPDSRRVFTCGSGADAIVMWDTASYQEVMTLGAEGSLFRKVALLEDECTLIATSWNNGFPALHVWRAPAWEEINAAEGRQERKSRSP